MQQTAILYPVFVLIALTVFLHIWMGRLRVGSLKTGDVKIADIALGQPNWTARATQVGNAYHNQHELPVLFYVVCAFVMITSRVDIVLVVLAWAFAVLRLVHAYIHTTHNRVPTRFNAYVAGGAVLIAMWVYFAIRIITAGIP